MLFIKNNLVWKAKAFCSFRLLQGRNGHICDCKGWEIKYRTWLTRGSSEVQDAGKHQTRKRGTERGGYPVFSHSRSHTAVWTQVSICDCKGSFTTKALGWVMFSSYLPLPQRTIPTGTPFPSPPAHSVPHFSAHLENPQRICSCFSWVLFQMLSQRLDTYTAKQITSQEGHLLIPTASELNGHWQH